MIDEWFETSLQHYIGLYQTSRFYIGDIFAPFHTMGVPLICNDIPIMNTIQTEVLKENKGKIDCIKYYYGMIAKYTTSE